MNVARRKELSKAISLFEEAKAAFEEALEILQNVAEEEEESLYNLPESLQEAERGQAMQENIDSLEEISSEIEDFDFEEITTMIQEVIDR